MFIIIYVIVDQSSDNEDSSASDWEKGNVIRLNTLRRKDRSSRHTGSAHNTAGDDEHVKDGGNDDTDNDPTMLESFNVCNNCKSLKYDLVKHIYSACYC